MERAIIGWPRWTAAATFAGGTWNAGYPVSNLSSLPLARVARSTGLTLAATQFTATLDRQRGVRCLALVRHNLSVNAKYRVRIWSDAGQTNLVYDSGWTPVWPPMFGSQDLEWESDNWWSLTYSPDDLTGTAWTTPIWLGQLYLASKITVEFDDQTNTAGYVDLGLFEISQGWQVTANPDYGAQEGFRFRTQEVEALGGTKYHDRRAKPRVWQGQISYLPREEALAQAFEHLRQADIDVPFLWFPYPDESTHWLRTVFLARNSTPGLMAHASPGFNSVPLSFEEVL